MNLDPRRGAVVAEAKTWLLTPYHHMGRVKGAGADCLTMLAEVYERAGITGHIEIPFYPRDWHIHRDEERYVAGVSKYAAEYWLDTDVDRCVPRVPSKPLPEPGDIALYKFGRAYAHGMIVVEWPRGIHAWAGVGVMWADATQPQLAERPARYFDPFVAPN